MGMPGLANSVLSLLGLVESIVVVAGATERCQRVIPLLAELGQAESSMGVLELADSGMTFLPEASKLLQVAVRQLNVLQVSCVLLLLLALQ